MAQTPKKINTSFFEQSPAQTMGELIDSADFQKTPPAKREIIKFGIKPLDTALECGGIEVGRVCNFEIYDRVFYHFAAFLLVSLAGNGKKIGLNIPQEYLPDFMARWTAMLQKTTPEKNRHSRDFLNVTCGFTNIQNIFGEAKEMGVELLVVFEPWKKFTSKGRVAEIETQAHKNNLAVITLNSAEYPAWNTKKRVGAPCLQTLLKCNQCDIMVAPIDDTARGSYKSTYVNDSFLKNAREMINSKCRVPFGLHLSFAGKPTQKTIKGFFSKHQPFGFSFT